MNDERQKIEENIRQLEAAKASGVLPTSVADASIAALKKEIATNDANLDGDGAIAQGVGTKAVGRNGVLIEGSVQGEIELHHVQAQTYIEKQFIETPETNQDVKKRRKALEAYLNRLSRACLSLPLATLGSENSTDQDVTLDKIYIELNTTGIREPRQETSRQGKKSDDFRENIRRRLIDDEKPITAIESASVHTRLVILGEAGAGKSTFIKKLLAWQASAYLGRTAMPSGFVPGLLPIFINLRDLAPRLAALDIENLPAKTGDTQLIHALWGYIQDDLGEDGADFFGELQDTLKSGRCFLALDGLDEVPQSLRGRVRQTVRTLLNFYNIQRIIVTCRVRSYVGEAVLPQFNSSTLAPLNKKQTEAFVQGWYNTQRDLGRISDAQAKEHIADLSKAASQIDLRGLSSNPMLLTTMAIIHQREVGLPRERVRLYNLAVEILMHRWQKHKMGETALAEFLKNDLKLRMVMESLAYAAHQASAESTGTGTLLRKDAVELLEKAENLGDLQLAGEFLDYVNQRAGLLVGYGGELSKPTAYSFPHRIFQEYLAGSYLASQRDRVRTFMAHAKNGDSWDLVIQIAFEELFYNRRSVNELLDIAYQLGAVLPHDEQQERAFLWAGQISSLVGRKALERDNHPAGGKTYLERLIPGFVALLSSRFLPSLERVEAGRILAKLGDPRADVVTCEHMAFCHVPGGSFLFGDGRKKTDLPDEFWIGKYPVTNAQYQQFIASGGYAEARYWTEAIEIGYWHNGEFKDEYDHMPRAKAADYGEPFSLSNHPAVGITWYEAQAFVRWLSDQSHMLSKQWSVENSKSEKALNDGFINNQLAIFLPSEQCWEKAARGSDSFTYPWGEKVNPDCANYHQTEIKTTNAVGCFINGGSSYGAMEMSGNVWEWTSTFEGSDSVIRGGSFRDDPDQIRCAFRLESFPNIKSRNVGFRVMVQKITTQP